MILLLFQYPFDIVVSWLLLARRRSPQRHAPIRPRSRHSAVTSPTPTIVGRAGYNETLPPATSLFAESLREDPNPVPAPSSSKATVIDLCSSDSEGTPRSSPARPSFYKSLQTKKVGNLDDH